MGEDQGEVFKYFNTFLRKTKKTKQNKDAVLHYMKMNLLTSMPHSPTHFSGQNKSKEKTNSKGEIGHLEDVKKRKGRKKNTVNDRAENTPGSPSQTSRKRENLPLPDQHNGTQNPKRSRCGRRARGKSDEGRSEEKSIRDY